MMYAGGIFNIADSLPAKKIARWDGSRWATLGVGMDDGGVFSMRVFSSSLYVGGTFTSIGGSLTNRIARWNGTSWAPVGAGFSGGVYALHSLGSNIYAGGDFDFANFQPASKIAVYNGSTWNALGSGIGGSSPKVHAIFSYLGDIIVGGHFTLAGGQSVNNIANWKLTVGITPLSSEIPVNYKLLQNYPNPFNPETQIRFDLPKTEFVNLSVYDSKGELVKILVNQIVNAGEYKTEFSSEGLTSGVYFYRIISGSYSETKKMVLVK